MENSKWKPDTKIAVIGGLISAAGVGLAVYSIFFAGPMSVTTSPELSESDQFYVLSVSKSFTGTTAWVNKEQTTFGGDLSANICLAESGLSTPLADGRVFNFLTPKIDEIGFYYSGDPFSGEFAVVLQVETESGLFSVLEHWKMLTYSADRTSRTVVDGQVDCETALSMLRKMENNQ